MLSGGLLPKKWIVTFFDRAGPLRAGKTQKTSWDK